MVCTKLVTRLLKVTEELVINRKITHNLDQKPWSEDLLFMPPFLYSSLNISITRLSFDHEDGHTCLLVKCQSKLNQVKVTQCQRMVNN